MTRTVVDRQPRRWATVFDLIAPPTKAVGSGIFISSSWEWVDIKQNGTHKISILHSGLIREGVVWETVFEKQEQTKIYKRVQGQYLNQYIDFRRNWFTVLFFLFGFPIRWEYMLVLDYPPEIHSLQAYSTQSLEGTAGSLSAISSFF